MAKKIFSIGALALASAISLAGGIGLVMVSEDAARLPLTVSPYPKLTPEDIANFISKFDPKDWEGKIDELIDLLNDNPDLLDAFTESFLENFDLEDYSLEELIALAQEYPEIAAAIAEKMGIDPADILASLAAMEAERTEYGEEASYYGDASGGISGRIDNGKVDPDREPTKLFHYSTPYQGTMYLRSASFGDYEPDHRSMGDAPEWDGSTFVATPLLYPGLSMAYAGNRSYSIEFGMEGHTDAGMIAPDYAGPYFTLESGERQLIPYTHESRIRRIDAETYSLDFFATEDISRFELPSYLVDDEARYRKFVEKRYSKVAPQIAKEIHEYRTSHRIFTPENLLRHFTANSSEFIYSPFAMDCPSDEDIVLYFLDHKEGTCSNYASASMLLLRDMGYPARYVTGYLVKSEGGSEPQSVNDTDCHAWVEYYVNGHGWQRFDATPSKRTKAEWNEDPNTDKVNYGGNPFYQPETMQLTDEETSSLGWHFFRLKSYSEYLSGAEFKPYEGSLDNTSKFLDSDSLFYASRYIQNGDAENTGLAFRFHATPNSDAKAAIVPQYPVRLEGFDWPIAITDAYFDSTDAAYYFGSFPMGSMPLNLEPGRAEIEDDAYAEAIQSIYTRIDDRIASEVKEWAMRNETLLTGSTLSTNSDVAIIKNALTRGSYLLPSTLAQDEEIPSKHIIELITSDNSRSIDYRYSASAMLLLRNQNIPCRLTQGYRAKTSDLGPENEYYYLEVYRKGIGWVAYDMNPENDTMTSDPLEYPEGDEAPTDEIVADEGNVIETDEFTNTFGLNFTCADVNATYDGTAVIPGLATVKATVNELGNRWLGYYTISFSPLSRRTNFGSVSIGYSVNIFYGSGAGSLVGQPFAYSGALPRGKINIAKRVLNVVASSGHYSPGTSISGLDLIDLSMTTGLADGEYIVVNDGVATNFDAIGHYFNNPTIRVYRDTESGTIETTDNYQINVTSGSFDIS